MLTCWEQEKWASVGRFSHIVITGSEHLQLTAELNAHLNSPVSNKSGVHQEQHGVSVRSDAAIAMSFVPMPNIGLIGTAV